MQIVYISDIHLEQSKNFIFEGYTSFDENISLFLLGDICPLNDEKLYKFLKYACDLFKNVIYIFGNHEFFCMKKRMSMDELKQYYFSHDLPKNLFTLDNNVLYLNTKTNEISKELKTITKDYFKIIGTTLWSDITKQASTYINDYRYIYSNSNSNKKLSYLDTIDFYNKNKVFLLDEIKSSPVKCMILTHHGVSSFCNGKEYENSNLKSAYASDITELFEYSDKIEFCINGHTHVNLNTTWFQLPNNVYIVNDISNNLSLIDKSIDKSIDYPEYYDIKKFKYIKLLSNCRGYPTEKIYKKCALKSISYIHKKINCKDIEHLNLFCCSFNEKILNKSDSIHCLKCNKFYCEKCHCEFNDKNFQK
jgi:predicted phosphodiesterase